MLAAAKAAHAAQGKAEMGITTANVDVDFKAVKAHVANVIAGIAPHDSVERFKGLALMLSKITAGLLAAMKFQAAVMWCGRNILSSPRGHRRLCRPSRGLIPCLT